MDVEIFKLSKQSNKRQLTQYLNSKNDDEVSFYSIDFNFGISSDMIYIQITALVEEKLQDYHAKNDVDTMLVFRALFIGIMWEWLFR